MLQNTEDRNNRLRRFIVTNYMLLKRKPRHKSIRRPFFIHSTVHCVCECSSACYYQEESIVEGSLLLYKEAGQTVSRIQRVQPNTEKRTNSETVCRIQTGIMLKIYYF